MSIIEESMIMELRELRAMRDRMQRESTRAVEISRFFAEAGKAITEKFGGDLKSRGRKLLEESAELHNEIADEWKLKQYGDASVREEIGDVLLVVASIAYRIGLDPIECAKDKLKAVMAK